MRFGLAMSAALVLAACASTEEPWVGDGAEAFDSSHTYCTRQAVFMASGVKESAYRACMAQRGWTQAPPAG